MHSITTFVSVLCLATSALAQYGDYGSSSSDGSYDGSSDTSGTENSSGSSSVTPAAASAPAPTVSSATPAESVKMHVIKVSNKAGDFVFEPNDLQVEAGEVVQFQFWPQNHSVVQSTFDQPCVPIHNVNASVPGFFSGFMPVKADATTRPTWSILINDTKPIWYYCSQGPHCQKGMVGVINPPAQNKSRTIESFKALAAQASTTNTAATTPFTGAANAFANSQGTVASVAMAVVLGLFVTCL